MPEFATVDDVLAFAPFAGLSREEAAQVAPHLDKLHVPAGEMLFRQGDPGDVLYLIQTGEVELLAGPEGREQSFGTVTAGGVFGEIGLLLGYPRTAAARVNRDATLWCISRAELDRGLSRREVWATRLLLAAATALAGRLARMDEKLLRLIEESQSAPASPLKTRVAELEALRLRLFTEWSF